LIIAGATFVLVLFLPETLATKILEKQMTNLEVPGGFKKYVYFLDTISTDTWLSLVGLNFIGVQIIWLNFPENHFVSTTRVTLLRDDFVLGLYLHGIRLCCFLHVSGNR
jgi:hypothetical protein